MRFLNEDEMPEADRRGYKYLMTYTQRGGGKEEEDKTQVYLIGTKDGIHWDREHQMSIFTGAISDGWMGMNYDPERKKYVSYCRPRDRYEGGPYKSPRDEDFLPNDSKHSIYSGVVRRIGRMERDALWTQEEAWSRTIFLPDDVDQKNEITSHMSMKVKIYGGVYFGFLIPYVPKELLWTELILSRDGKSFERTHQPFIPTGAPGAWDSGQAWVTPDWVEVGDEWWITYHGANSAPNVAIPKDTTWGIGLAKTSQGRICLAVHARGRRRDHHAAAEVARRRSARELRCVARRDARAGLGQGPARLRWIQLRGLRSLHRQQHRTACGVERAQLDELKDKEVRLEFYFAKSADLYSIRAEGGCPR